MTQGLVFGKFYPFHTGHQALIDFALGHCDQLIILVCATDSETIAGETRKDWLVKTYASDQRVRVDLLMYDEQTLPNTSVSSRAVSQKWAAFFSARYPSLSFVCTSEPYGEFLAEFMQIEHISFDPKRSLQTISGTEIREKPLRHWEFLPKAVRPHYLKKVVILGTESTGKTTLCQRLAAHYNTGYVEEAGRLVIKDSRNTSYHDLEITAKTHAEMIIGQERKANKLLFIDTDIHITMSYCRYLFKTDLQVADWIKQANRADLCLFLDNDAPYIQDGGRLHKPERDALHQSHLETLASAGVQFHLINGTWGERFEKAKELIQATFFRINVH